MAHTVNIENKLGYDWNSNDLFVILILAGVALGRAWAQAQCVSLFVSVWATEICGLAFSWYTNIPSTEIAMMLQLGSAPTDNYICLWKRFLSYFNQLLMETETNLIYLYCIYTICHNTVQYCLLVICTSLWELKKKKKFHSREHPSTHPDIHSSNFQSIHAPCIYLAFMHQLIYPFNSIDWWL